MKKLMTKLPGLPAGAILTVALLLAGFAGTAMALGDNGPLRSQSAGVAESDLKKNPLAMAGGSGFEIEWQTLSGGATFATGGNYQLRGSVGQVDADPDHPAQSADFAHTGGFWSLFLASESVELMIFRDRFETGGR